MTNPKFLDEDLIPESSKKVPYSVRIEKSLLDGLEAYSKMNDLKKSEVLTILIKSFLKDKVLYNDYLNIKGLFLNIPLIYSKEIDFDIYESPISLDDSLEIYPNKPTSDTFRLNEYEVKKIPNNLDVWNGNSYASDSDSFEHEGIEVLIVPEVFNVISSEYNSLDFCCYFILFQVKEGNLTIKLINYLEALNKFKKVNNYSMISKLINLKKEINSYKQEIKALNPEKILDSQENLSIESKGISDLAKKYNTNNVVPISKSEAIDYDFEEEVKDNPSLIDVIHDQEKRISKLEEELSKKD